MKRRDLFFEEIHGCLLCDSKVFEVLYKANSSGIENTHVICPHCSLVFQNPRPTKQTLEEYYRSEYAKILNREEEGNKAPNEQALRNAFIKAKRVYKFIEPYLPFKDNEGYSVLDIGSSAGILLNLFKERGYETYGVEPNEIFANYSKRNGHQIEIGLYSGFFFKNNRFDVITLVHVLEHSTNPVETLISARLKLKDNGLLAVEVPNLLRPNGPVNGFFQLPHLYTFSKETLLRIFKLAGFHNILTIDDYYPHLRVLAQNDSSKTPKINEISKEFPNYMKVLKELKRFSWRYRLLITPIQILKKGLNRIGKIALPGKVYYRVKDIYYRYKTL